jgi:transposase-like protein
MMAEREVLVRHTTIMRWVRHSVPEYQRCWSRFSQPTSPSWRMDETAVSVQGRWNYLYRAVDRNGKSIHSLLCEDRSIRSAQTFFRQAINVSGSGWPQRINLDGNVATPARQYRDEPARTRVQHETTTADLRNAALDGDD